MRRLSMLSHLKLILQAITPLRDNRVWPRETSSSVASCQDNFVFNIGVGAGPAGQVLAGPLLFKVKIK